MRVNIFSINKFLLYFCTLAFICCFFYSNKIYAYNCYAASNAGTVAPDNGTVCANKYIIKNVNLKTKTKKGNKELSNATHSGSDAYITYQGERYWFGEASGQKNIFTGQVVNFNRALYNKRNFNADIGYWDMSSAVVTAEMFKGASKFLFRESIFDPK